MIDRLQAAFHPPGVGFSRVSEIVRGFPTLAAVVLGFCLSLGLGAVILVSIGVDPVRAAQTALGGSFATASGVSNTLVFATPRLLVALGAIVAIRCGVFNLGGEGQLQMGAAAAAFIGVVAVPGGRPIHLLLAIAAAAGAGGIWAGIAAALHVLRDARILISTLLMNFVAIYFVQFLVQGPFQEQDSIFSQSPRVLDAAELPALLPGTRLHAGLLLGILAAVGTSVLLYRTTLGREIRASGLNSRGANFLGLRPQRMIVLSMVISGMIGGLAGATEVLGVHYRLLAGFSSNIGFEGLAVAFLGGLRPGPTVAMAIVFGALQAAVLPLQHELGVPAAIALIVGGLPIVTLAAVQGLVMLKSGE